MPAQKECLRVFDSGGFFLTNFQEEIVEGKIFDVKVPDKFSVLHKYKLIVGVDYETQH